MPSETHSLTMAKAPMDEWEKVFKFVQELEDMVSPRWGQSMPVTDEQLGAWVRKNMPPMMRTVYGYRVLVDNCCDPNVTHLAFKPELSTLMEKAKGPSC